MPIVQKGRTRRLPLLGLAAAVVPFLQNWYKGDKGDPGGSTMAIGSFQAASTLLIPAGTDLVHTVSWATGSGLGKARYIADATVDDAYLAANPASSFKTANGRRFVLAEEALTPEMFGALGDGLTDDTAAFRTLSAYVNAMKGGVIELTPGAVYIAGYQYKLGSFYRFGGVALQLKDCDSVEIRGNGATIRAPSGMKFGTFDPSTGQPFANSQPYYDNGERRADIGQQFEAWNVRRLRVYDLICDGNVAQQQIGGYWGDLGRQCAGDGYFIRTCGDVLCVGLRAINQARDGGLVAEYADDLATMLTAEERVAPRPHTFINCSTYNVARNGFSNIGCSNFLALNCDFDRSGKVYNDGLGATYGTAPGSGVDVEAEGGTCRNVRFKSCRFGAATGNSFVADTGDTRDILLEDCEIADIFWTSKLFTRLVRCTFNGPVRRFVGGADVQHGATVFQDCTIVGDRPGDLVLDSQGSGGGTFLGSTRVEIRAGGINARGSLFESLLIDVAPGAAVLDGSKLVGYLEDTRGNAITFNAPAGSDYWLSIDANVRVTKPIATGGAKWGVAGPTFGGRLYVGSLAIPEIINQGTFEVSFFTLEIFGARVGDHAETRFDGVTGGALFYATVRSDNVLDVAVMRPPGSYHRAGNLKVRLAKEKML